MAEAVHTHASWVRLPIHSEASLRRARGAGAHLSFASLFMASRAADADSSLCTRRGSDTGRAANLLQNIVIHDYIDPPIATAFTVSEG